MGVNPIIIQDKLYEETQKIDEQSDLLIFTHVATGTVIEIKTGLKSFTDNFSSNWNSESVYGRMDPIMTFQNTQRQMSLEFIAGPNSNSTYKFTDPNGSKRTKTGQSDIEAVQFLASLLYPTYTNDNSLSIKDPPLLRIYYQDIVGKEGTEGLLVAVESLTYDRGTLYSPKSAAGGDREILKPDFINVTVNFTPLHEFDLGWEKVKVKNLQKRDLSANPKAPSKETVWRFGGKSGEDKIFQNGVIIKDYTKK